MNEVVTQDNEGSAQNAKIIYILYLVGIVVGITGLVGVIMAYINKDEAPDWLKSHYQFLIRTFWIGLLYCVVGIISAVFIIGIFILLFWVVWLIIRCVKGMKALDAKQPHPDPTGWMF